MATKSHKTLTGNQLHEPKGIDAASVDTVYISDGAGSGAYAKIGADQTDGTVGNLVLIKTLTASSSTALDFINGASSVVFDSTYDVYLFEIFNLVPASDDNGLSIRFGTGVGSWDSANQYDTVWDSYSGLAYNHANQAKAYLTRPFGGTAAVSNTTSEGGFNGWLKVYTPTVSAYKNATFHGSHWRADDVSNTSVFGSCLWKSTSTATSLRFVYDGGNIASGTINMYGIKA